MKPVCITCRTRPAAVQGGECLACRPSCRPWAPGQPRPAFLQRVEHARLGGGPETLRAIVEAEDPS